MNSIVNEDLLREITLSQERGKVTDKLAAMWVNMIDRRLTISNFRDWPESTKDDMKSEALLTLCRIGLNFNTTKSSDPFSFYSSSITGSFYGVVSREKREKLIKDTSEQDIEEDLVDNDFEELE